MFFFQNQTKFVSKIWQWKNYFNYYRKYQWQKRFMHNGAFAHFTYIKAVFGLLTRQWIGQNGQICGLRDCLI